MTATLNSCGAFQLHLSSFGDRSKVVVFASKDDVQAGRVEHIDEDTIRYHPGQVDHVVAIVMTDVADDPESERYTLRKHYYQLVEIAGTTPHWIRQLFDAYYGITEICCVADIAALQWAEWFWNTNRLPARKLLPELIAAHGHYLAYLRAQTFSHLNGVKPEDCFQTASAISHRAGELSKRFLAQQARGWRRQHGTKGLESFSSRMLDAVLELGQFYSFASLSKPRIHSRFDFAEDKYWPYFTDKMRKNYRIEKDEDLYPWSRNDSVLVLSAGIDVNSANLLSETFTTAIRGIEA